MHSLHSACTNSVFLLCSTDTTVLAEDIGDLRESSRHNLRILHTQMTVENNALQQQIDTLRGTVDRLNDAVSVLSDWKASSEERLTSLENRVQENYDEFYSGIHEVVNKARDLEDVIERYHPNSFHGTPLPIPDHTGGGSVPQTLPTENTDSTPVVVQEVLAE